MPIIPHNLQNIWLNRWVGLVFILLVIGLMVSTKPANKCHNAGYIHINGIFGNVDGIKKSTPILVAGVPIGVVCAMQYQNESRRVLVDLAVDKRVQIPDDSAMVILSEGFGGAKYIKVSLGGSPMNFANNDSFQYSQDAILFDVLLSKIINLAEQNQKNKAKEGETAPATSNKKSGGQ